MNILISNIKQYKYTIIFGLLTIILSICLFFSIRSCCDAKKIANNNLIALTDTIEYYQTKTGNLVAIKTLLEGDLSTLKIANDSLYDAIKNMKLDNPSAAVSIQGTINNGVNDTVWVISHIKDISDSAIHIRKDFAFNNQYRSLEGYVSYTDSLLGLNIETDKVYFDYTAVIQDNKLYITSSNPYVTYDKIQGITIPNIKRKWSLGIGPHVGYGYNFVAKKFNPYIGIGVNIQYNLLQW